MTDTPFPDHEYLTVKELAELLRLKERKVYDLAASGQVPCSRATGKLLFPADEIRAWIAQAQSGGVPGAAARVDRPAVVLGSHDPLLDWAIRESRSGMASYFDGSLDGLERFVRGEGVATGLHIRDARRGDWNVPAVSAAASDQNAVLIAFARRRRGLVYASGGAAPQRLADLAGLRMVPRQPESGTHGLLADLARAEGLDLSRVTLTAVARTEDDAVGAVRRGEADVAFGLEAVARSYGLEFAPVVEEEFALLVDRKAWFDPPMRRFMAFCQGEAFRHKAAAYGGYDVADLGEVRWNA
ncbi:helix-turn-helix transcriptional regulator [Maliponia aquimaris]|uniref:PBP superfamily domain protein n=1 Tax=Maliponia aquimaris TaxID=1673631 RepID=A0A238K1L2_9RHOB|nr:helix-turn-helix transcriptional regulator [Maliponia aquimaris]SMX35846.1 PBP superfamily domain protein [Maliponia aquimaris]